MQAELARDNGLVSCTVTVDAETVAAAFDRAYSEWAASLKVPGFRRGHAPRNIVKARANQEEVRRSVLAEIVPPATQQVMTKYRLEALEGPTLESYHLREGEPLVFRFSLVERPQVNLAGYDELRLDGFEETETPDVEAALEELRQGRARMEQSEEAAGEADVVEGELEFHREDGNWLIDEHARIDLSNERVEDDIRRSLLGIQAQEEREFEVKDEQGQRRGKGRFKALRVLQKAVPELDDEFARTVSRVQSLEELRARLSEELERRSVAEQEQKQRRAVLQQLVDKSQVQVPVYSTVRLAAGILGDLVDTLRARGMSLESLRGEGPNSAQQVFQQALESAQQRIKEQLVVAEVAKRERIEVEPPAGEAEESEEVERQRAALLREKVMQWLMERAQQAAVKESGEAPEKVETEAKADASTDGG